MPRIEEMRSILLQSESALYFPLSLSDDILSLHFDIHPDSTLSLSERLSYFDNTDDAASGFIPIEAIKSPNELSYFGRSDGSSFFSADLLRFITSIK